MLAPPYVFTDFDKLLRKADAKRRDWKRKQGKSCWGEMQKPRPPGQRSVLGNCGTHELIDPAALVGSRWRAAAVQSSSAPVPERNIIYPTPRVSASLNFAPYVPPLPHSSPRLGGEGGAESGTSCPNPSWRTLSRHQVAPWLSLAL